MKAQSKKGRAGSADKRKRVMPKEAFASAAVSGPGPIFTGPALSRRNGVTAGLVPPDVASAWKFPSVKAVS